MNKEINLDSFRNNLEKLKNIDDNGVEFWYARELQKALGYTKWEKFYNAIKKAIDNCDNTNFPIKSNFVEVFPDPGKNSDNKEKNSVGGSNKVNIDK